MQNYVYPSAAASANASVSGNGSPIPGSSTLVAGENPSLNLQPLQTDGSGNLLVSIAAGFPNPLPVTQSGVWNITNITGTVSLPTGASTSALQTTGNTSLASIVTNTTGLALANQFPSTLGAHVTSASTAVNIASDQVVPVSASALPLPSGAATSALQTTGNTSLASIVTNTTGLALSSQLPASLGAKTTAASVAVNIASDQTVPVSAASLPLPSGAATSALQTTGNTSLASIDSKTPALGQALAGSSVPVVLTAAQLTTLTPLTSVTVTQSTASNLKTAAYASTPTALTVTQAAITVGTSAVRLTVSGSAPASTRVVLVATPDNASTAHFFIGGSSVTAFGGIEIVAGQPFIANNDAGDYWIISDTAAQTVYVMEQS